MSTFSEDIVIGLCTIAKHARVGVLIGLSVAAFPTSRNSAQPARAPQTIPVRELSPPIISPRVFANIFNVRQVAGGNVLVNDGLSRQVVLLDAKLAQLRVVLDSVASPTGERYGAVAAPLIAHLADSSFFVDPEAKALLVIDPNGRVVRTAASPTGAREFRWLFASQYTTSDGTPNDAADCKSHRDA